jgi:hypothetical protein
MTQCRQRCSIFAKVRTENFIRIPSKEFLEVFSSRTRGLNDLAEGIPTLS